MKEKDYDKALILEELLDCKRNNKSTLNARNYQLFSYGLSMLYHNVSQNDNLTIKQKSMEEMLFHFLNLNSYLYKSSLVLGEFTIHKNYLIDIDNYLAEGNFLNIKGLGLFDDTSFLINNHNFPILLKEDIKEKIDLLHNKKGNHQLISELIEKTDLILTKTDKNFPSTITKLNIEFKKTLLKINLKEAEQNNLNKNINLEQYYKISNELFSYLASEERLSILKRRKKLFKNTKDIRFHYMMGLSRCLDCYNVSREELSFIENEIRNEGKDFFTSKEEIDGKIHNALSKVRRLYGQK